MPNEIYCMHCMNKVPEGVPICSFCQKDPRDYHAELHHLPPNTILYGKYLIGRVLGEGGFGITYIARDLNLDIRVAVKEYYPYGCVNRNHSYSEDITVSGNVSNQEFETGKRKLMGEARTLAIFSDLKGIVGVRDFFLFNNTAYIVMDYLEGITLKEYLKTKTTIPFNEIVELLMPIMEDLVKVHETGLIHRDISPDNIMILKDGTARLMDFGAARQTEGTDTKSLSIVLKPGYTPEEQYRSRGEQGPWTDVYALCATIYKAVTGILPDEALQRLVEDTVKAPSELGVDIPKGKEWALMKGLAVFRKDRFENIAQLINGLKNGEKTDQTLIPKAVSSVASGGKAIGQDSKKKQMAGIVAAVVFCIILAFAIENTWTQSAKRTALIENESDKVENPLEDYELKINGEDYKFPMSYQELKAKGWELINSSEDDMIENGLVYGYSARLSGRSDLTPVTINICNPNDEPLNLQDCYVSGMAISDLSYIVSLPKEIMFKSTQEDLISAFGEPTSTYAGTVVSSCAFSFDEGKWGFHFGRGGGLIAISLSNESISKEFTKDLSGEEQTEEVVKQYEKPQELGDDLLSGVVKYDGDLYWMVCPLSAMLENGWSISPMVAIDCLAAGESMQMELVRNGKKQEVEVTNLGTEAHWTENCFVTRFADYDGKLVLPGGIRVGMMENDCFGVIEESGYSIWDKSEIEDIAYYYIVGLLSSSMGGQVMVAIEDGTVICVIYDAYEIE